MTLTSSWVSPSSTRSASGHDSNYTRKSPPSWVVLSSSAAMSPASRLMSAAVNCRPACVIGMSSFSCSLSVELGHLRPLQRARDGEIHARVLMRRDADVVPGVHEILPREVHDGALPVH